MDLFFTVAECAQVWAVSEQLVLLSPAGSGMRKVLILKLLLLPGYLSELLWWRRFEVWDFSASSDPSRPPSGQIGGRRTRAAGRATTARTEPVKEQERKRFWWGVNWVQGGSKVKTSTLDHIVSVIPWPAWSPVQVLGVPSTLTDSPDLFWISPLFDWQLINFLLVNQDCGFELVTTERCWNDNGSVGVFACGSLYVYT